MPNDQLADTELDGEGETGAKTVCEEQLRALAAIHGGLGEDLLAGLPGVDAFVDDDLFGGGWPHGWVPT
jgi:hypothetical protein